MQTNLDDMFEQGPVLYRRDLDLPGLEADEHVTLHFDGVSYACKVRLNGVLVGEHIGIWDGFSVPLTEAAQAGRNELEVEVTRPATLEAGPESPSRPGPYPIRRTLSGFLPYVWGDIFGGLWQDVWLVRGRSTYPAELRVSAWGDGQLAVTGVPAGTRLTVLDPHDVPVCLLEAPYRGQIDGAAHWAHGRPQRYTLRLEIGGECFEQRFAFRTLTAAGQRLLINGESIYPRLLLSWGWYEGCLHSNPGPTVFREELLRAKELGFNGVKLCLWVPPAAYFELADELGMLLWLELPMWLPELTPEVRAQTRLEYQRILAGLSHHPSLILVTLGCELNAKVDRDFLQTLFTDAKERLPGVLLRDNSGGGEAYGGLLDECADFFDHHFYSEAPTFGPLLDHFTPRWRPQQPWVFGEFCDSDAFRDARELSEALHDPWWLSADLQRNPQGARWQMDVHEHASRLAQSGLGERVADLHAASRHHSLLHRKLTIEAVRARSEIAGYTITGMVDTPISSAGMWTDLGETRFDAEALRRFNADTVFLCGFTRRRAWMRGGDRAAYTDHFNHRSGGIFRVHIVVAHAGPEPYRGRLDIRLLLDGRLLHTQRADVSVVSADVREVAIFEVRLPAVETPGQLELQVSDGPRRNAWKHWLYPTVTPPTAHLHDPLDVLGSIAGLTAPAESKLWVSTLWDEATRRALCDGRRVLLLQSKPGGPTETFQDPFWREAVSLIERHPAWGDFPHEGHPDTQFVAITPDLSFEPLPGSEALLTRLDARTMRVSSYASIAPYQTGLLLHTSLRLAGGLGDQPQGARNTVGQYLLARFLEHLESRATSDLSEQAGPGVSSSPATADEASA